MRVPQVYDTIDALVFLHQLDPPVIHGDIKAVSHVPHGVGCQSN